MPKRIGYKAAGRIKTSIGDGGEWVLNILAVPFGSLDNKDSAGEFFTKNTDIMTQLGDRRPVVHLHGMNLERTKMEIIQFGFGTFTKTDEDGHWVSVVIDKTKKHARRIWKKADLGKVFASTGVAGMLKTVKSTGELIVWAVGEITVVAFDGFNMPSSFDAVVMPELKMMYTDNKIKFPKEFAKSLERLEANEREEEKQEKTGGLIMTLQELIKMAYAKAGKDKKLHKEVEGIIAAGDDVAAKLKVFIGDEAGEDDEDGAISEEAISGIVNLVLNRVTKQLDKSPALMKLAQLGSGGDPDEGPVEEFWHYMKTGDSVPAKKAGLMENDVMAFADDERTKVAWESTSGSGAVATPDGVFDSIKEKLGEDNILFTSNAEVIFRNISGMPIPFEDTSMTKFIRTAEQAAYDQDEGTIDTVDLAQEKFTKQIKATEEVLQFTNQQLDSYFMRRAAAAMDETINFYLAVGTGTNQPAGVMSLASSLTFDANNAIAAAEVVELYYKLKQKYRKNAVWGYNDTTAGVIRAKTGDGFQFLPTPQGSFDDLMNLKTHEQNDIADIGTVAKSLFLANFEFYTMLMSEQVYVLFDPFTAKSTGQASWWIHFYMDGSPTIAEAFAVGQHPA